MADQYDNDKRPHGETGDTVQQAAEVSRPTTSVGRVLNDDEIAQVPPDSKTGTDARDSAGGGDNAGGPGGPDTGSDAMPGRSNAL